jgi:hypothetical protein
VIDGEVGQVEEAVAHARVLPVDDPNVAVLVEEVQVLVVVVAGDRHGPPAGRLDAKGDAVGPLEDVRDRDAVRGSGLGVHLDDAERIEAARDRGPVVDAPQDSGRAGDRLGPAHLLGRDRPSFDETRDEVALGLDEADDLGPDPKLGGDERGAVLDGAINGEELRILAPDPENDDLTVDCDLEVLVGQPAVERLEHELAARPDAFGNVLRFHRAILDWRTPWPRAPSCSTSTGRSPTTSPCSSRS